MHNFRLIFLCQVIEYIGWYLLLFGRKHFLVHWTVRLISSHSEAEKCLYFRQYLAGVQNDVVIESDVELFGRKTRAPYPYRSYVVAAQLLLGAVNESLYLVELVYALKPFRRPVESNMRPRSLDRISQDEYDFQIWQDSLYVLDIRQIQEGVRRRYLSF